MDSLNKRIEFVKAVINELELKKADAAAARAEDLARSDLRESFDFCTSRAVARMNVLLEYCLPFVKVGGCCILYKSVNCEEEIEEAQAAASVLGGTFEEVIRLTLPVTGDPRSLVVVRKISSTPGKFPRRAGTFYKSGYRKAPPPIFFQRGLYTSRTAAQPLLKLSTTITARLILPKTCRGKIRWQCPLQTQPE